MQIFATFDHSPYLELAIRMLEQEGYKDIFAVPLDNRKEFPRLLDSIHHSDGVSLINKGMFLAVIFSVIAASRGFVLEWGPIIWGVLGAISGFMLGFIIDFTMIKVKQRKQKLLRRKKSEVILIINCQDEDGRAVESILWEHLANGVAKVK